VLPGLFCNDGLTSGPFPQAPTPVVAACVRFSVFGASPPGRSLFFSPQAQTHGILRRSSFHKTTERAPHTMFIPPFRLGWRSAWQHAGEVKRIPRSFKAPDVFSFMFSLTIFFPRRWKTDVLSPSKPPSAPNLGGRIPTPIALGFPISMQPFCRRRLTCVATLSLLTTVLPTPPFFSLVLFSKSLSSSSPRTFAKFTPRSAWPHTNCPSFGYLLFGWGTSSLIGHLTILKKSPVFLPPGPTVSFAPDRDGAL